MENSAEIAAVVMDGVIIVLLVGAIILGGTLLLQIMKLRQERFKFDQMTKALGGQLAIFQSALENGKLDMDVKISRMNSAIERAQKVADHLHNMIEKGEGKAVFNPGALPGETKAVAGGNVPPRMRRAPVISRIEDKPAKKAEESSEEEGGLSFNIIDPEFMKGVKEDDQPAISGFDDLSDADRKELAKLETPAERNLMAALKRAGRG